MRKHGRDSEARRAFVEHFIYRIQKAARILGQAQQEREAEAASFPDYKPIKGFAPEAVLA